MSGIFKGDSIYKSGGGGGGGFKDGGQLVDGDFIKVENNSISTYTNTSRSDINYYFEIQEGEVLNAVVELTNEYNATVHVYILQNGLYIPLGNVGGDTVNAGDNYKINVVGNSFMLENVTPAQAVPEYVTLDGNIYPCKLFDGLLWLTQDLKSISGLISHTEGGYTYFLLDDNLKNFNLNGWRIPNKSDWNYILGNFTQAELKTSSGWQYHNGTNTSEFSYSPGGFYQYGADPIKVYDNGKQGIYASWNSDDNRWSALTLIDFAESLSWANAFPGYNYYCIRLVRDI